MKQRQSPKEQPRTGDKHRTIAMRVDEWLFKEFHRFHRGSAWARKVLEAAIKKEDGKS
jgi:hypothetical protein